MRETMKKDSIAEMALTLLGVMGCPSCTGNRFKMDDVNGWTRIFCLQCERVVSVPPGRAEELHVKVKIFGEDGETTIDWHTLKTGNVLERMKDA